MLYNIGPHIKHIKAIVRCHYTLSRMFRIQNWTASNAGGEATGTFIHCWWGCKMVQPLWKTARQFLTKLNMFLLYKPAVTLLGIYLKELKGMSTQRPTQRFS